MTIFTGTVISNKTAQTLTVVVRRQARHPLYGKSITRTKKYHVHDTQGVEVGAEVKFTPCKPISKTKRWKVVEVVKPAQAVTQKKKDTTAKTVTKSKAKTKTKSKKQK